MRTKRQYTLKWKTPGNPTVHYVGTYNKRSDALTAYKTKLLEFGVQQTEHRHTTKNLPDGSKTSEDWFYANYIGKDDSEYKEYIFSIERVWTAV